MSVITSVHTYKYFLTHTVQSIHVINCSCCTSNVYLYLKGPKVLAFSCLSSSAESSGYKENIGRLWPLWYLYTSHSWGARSFGGKFPAISWDMGQQNSSPKHLQETKGKTSCFHTFYEHFIFPKAWHNISLSLEFGNGFSFTFTCVLQMCMFLEWCTHTIILYYISVTLNHWTCYKWHISFNV